jgi:hypothetical protein
VSPRRSTRKGRCTGPAATSRRLKGCHQQALEQARAIASPWTEAQALAGLGRCALAAGHTERAAQMLRNALEIFQRIGAVEAAAVSAELDAATEAQLAERPAVRRTDQ